MIRFRLVTLDDNTPYVRKKIQQMAEDYCARSEDSGATAEDIYEVFQGYSCTNISTPHFWLALDEQEPIGFMVTEIVEYNGKKGLQITQGYLKDKYARTKVSYGCISHIEKIAMENDCKFVSCITRLDPKAYGRWLKPAGYERDYTAFIKRI